MFFEENTVKSHFSFSYFKKQRKKSLKKENRFKLVLYCSTVQVKVYQRKVLTNGGPLFLFFYSSALQFLVACYWLLRRSLIRWWCSLCWQKIGRALWLVAITLCFEKQTPTCENCRSRRWLFKHTEKKFYWASGAYIKRGKLFILH